MARSNVNNYLCYSYKPLVIYLNDFLVIFSITFCIRFWLIFDYYADDIA